MEFDQFMLRHLEIGKEVSRTINGWSYDWFAELAKLTKYIDYGCDFDKNGICKKYRQGSLGTTENRVMCCCNNCARNNGFLDIIPASTYLQHKYCEMYDDNTGYWRKGTGCILPRKMRSYTCLQYNCTPNRYVKSSGYVLLYNLLRERPESIKINGRKRKSRRAIVNEMEKWLIKEAHV